jgi:hypothetical protein
VWVDTSYDIAPSYYSFCAVRDFGSSYLRPVILPRERNVTFIQNTVNITNITYNNYNNVVFNGGPNYHNINRRSARQVPSLKLVQNNNFDRDGRGRGGRGGRGGLPRSVQRGNQLEVFSPDVERGGEENFKPKIRKVIPGEKVRKGLREIKDPALRAQLKEKMQQESKGLTPDTAPAKAVQVADLQGVPEKADPNAPSPAGTDAVSETANDATNWREMQLRIPQPSLKMTRLLQTRMQRQPGRRGATRRAVKAVADGTPAQWPGSIQPKKKRGRQPKVSGSVADVAPGVSKAQQASPPASRPRELIHPQRMKLRKRTKENGRDVIRRTSSLPPCL